MLFASNKYRKLWVKSKPVQKSPPPPFLDYRDWSFVKNRPQKNHHGVFGGARFADVGEIARGNAFSQTGIPIARALDVEKEEFKSSWAPWLRHDTDGHLMLCAPSGAGKATDTLIPALLAPCDTGNWLIIDPKGQLAAVTKPARTAIGFTPPYEAAEIPLNRKSYYLNPFGLFTDRLGQSIGFNPMENLNPDNVAYGADCDALAAAIVWETGGDAHWSSSALVLISGLIMYFRKYAPVDEQNLVSVRSAVAAPPNVFSRVISSAMATGDILIIERLSRFVGMTDDDREAKGILSTAKTQTAFIGNEAIRYSLKAKGGGFQFSKLRAEKGCSVFVILPGEYLDTCGKWFRLVVGAALRELMANPHGEKVTFLMDEFAQLGKLSAIETAVALGRGYNLRMWPVLQNLTQLKNLYGDNWETFLANTATQIYYAPRDQFTAEYLSKKCGQQTIKVVSKSENEISKLQEEQGFSGISFSTNDQGVPLLRPEEVQGIHPTKALVFWSKVSKPILAHRMPYWEITGIGKSYYRDPYFSGHEPSGFKPRPFAEKTGTD